jgi:hypothetical protein
LPSDANVAAKGPDLVLALWQVLDKRRLVLPQAPTGNGLASLLEFQMLVKYPDTRHRACCRALDCIPISGQTWREP